MSIAITNIKDKEPDNESIKRMNIWTKMNDLEKEAERVYIENTDQHFIFACLTHEEQEEYRTLYKEFYKKEYNL